MQDSPSPVARTEAQRAAARANGARSRGPLSPAGKARASRNALRHGLAAAVHLVIDGEDPADLAHLVDGLRAEYDDPRPSRAVLVERLAAAVWKLRRAERLEAALHALPPRPAPGWIGPDPGLPTALTRLPEYATLVRHQGQLERFLLRALRALEPPDPAGPADRDSSELGPSEPGPCGPAVDDLDWPAPDRSETATAVLGAAPAPEPARSEPAPPEPDPVGSELLDPGAHAAGPPGRVGREPPAAAGAPSPAEPPDAAPPGAEPPGAEPPEANSLGASPAAAAPGGAADGAGGPGQAAGAELGALARACAERLLREGRPQEAARLARLWVSPALRRAGGPPEPAPPEPLEAILARALADATPEERAEWDGLGYDSWVVPPGCGRRPMASLEAEWVCPADRWRVLEELLSVADPAEEARVLGHFARAGLDPGLDHPAFAGRTAAPLPLSPTDEAPEPPSEAARASGPPSATASPPPTPSSCEAPSPSEAPRPSAALPGPEAASGRPRAPNPLWVRLGQEAEAYHGAGRARRAAEAWLRHARELGVPVPAHAGLDPAASEPGSPPVPGDPAAAAPPPATVWPQGVGIRPPAPLPPDWPWSPEDGLAPEELARRAASAPRPAPPGRTTVPAAPATAAGRTGPGTTAPRAPGPPLGAGTTAPSATAASFLLDDPPGARRPRSLPA